MKDKLAVVENVAGREGEYLIKDNTGITVGRFYLIDYFTESRSCTFRISFYRKSNFYVLREAVSILLRKIFTSTNTYKVNLLIDEEKNIRALTELGLNLEGILEDNLIMDGCHKSELIFGINTLDFERNDRDRTSSLRLRGNKVDLKVLSPEDDEDMLKYYIRNKEHLQPYEPDREESFYTLDVQRRILMENYKQYLNGQSLSFGIYKDEKLIGRAQLSNIVMGIFKSAFVGYSMDKEYQGRGYMKDALSLILDYAFNEMELHRIEASTLVDNIKSQRVLLGCGFKELGINKGYLFINGAWRDHKTFYIVNNFKD